MVAGLCFSFGGFLARVPGWPHLFQSAIWLPLVLLCLVRALKASERGRALAYAAFCGFGIGLSILAGGLHVVIMQALTVAAAAVFGAARTPSGEDAPDCFARWRRATLIVGVAALVAAAAGAVQLLSSAEYSQHALRYTSHGPVPASERIPYDFLNDNVFAHSPLNLLISFAYGGQIGSGEVLNPYFGVFPLLLAAIGIWKGWRRRWIPFFAGLAAAAFLYAMGSYSLLHGLLYALAPYLWLAREAPRFLFLADFSLALLAGVGAEILFSGACGRDAWQPLTRWLPWVVLAVVVALAVPAIYGQPPMSPWVSLSLLLIVASCLLFRWISGGRTGTAARFLAVALILFDLSAFDWSAGNRNELAAKGGDELTRLLSCQGFIGFLKSRPGLFRVSVASDWPPNIGDAYRVQNIGGNGVTLLADYARFMGQGDLLNVRYVIKPAAATDPRPVYQDASWKVYENPHAYPRAWLVHDVRVVPSPMDFLDHLGGSGVDLHRTALLAARLERPLDPAPAEAVETADFERYEANRLDLRVRTASRALLVLSEIDYPGWTATVNGHSTPIRKVDGTLRCIVVPAGVSRVALQYRPTSIYAGAALSLAAFGLLLPALVGWRLLHRARSLQ